MRNFQVAVFVTECLLAYGTRALKQRQPSLFPGWAHYKTFEVVRLHYCGIQRQFNDSADFLK